MKIFRSLPFIEIEKHPQWTETIQVATKPNTSTKVIDLAPRGGPSLIDSFVNERRTLPGIVLDLDEAERKPIKIEKMVSPNFSIPSGRILKKETRRSDDDRMDIVEQTNITRDVPVQTHLSFQNFQSPFADPNQYQDRPRFISPDSFGSNQFMMQNPPMRFPQGHRMPVFQNQLFPQNQLLPQHQTFHDQLFPHHDPEESQLKKRARAAMSSFLELDIPNRRNQDTYLSQSSEPFQDRS